MGRDEDDNDDNSSDECLQQLLGGRINFEQEWEEEEEQPQTDAKVSPGLVNPYLVRRQSRNSRQVLVPSTTTSMTTSRLADAASAKNNNNNEYDVLFQNTPHHKVERPPLQIVDLPGRGRGLVATQVLSKGQVIYTERAAVATLSSYLIFDKKVIIQACQHCFRSLEYWTKLWMLPSETHQDSEHYLSTPQRPSIPFPELWPVLPLEFKHDDDGNDNDDNNHNNETTRTDRHGRVQCKECHSIFCTRLCYQHKQNEIGTCCLECKVLDNLPSLLRDDDDIEISSIVADGAPVRLGAVLFLQLVQYYRTHQSSLMGHWFQQICGTADVLQSLELGIAIHQKEDGTIHYSLAPLYDYIIELCQITNAESGTLSLDLLQSLVAKAARNGVGLSTQSPFKSYYAGLLRQTNYGGRNSEAHHRHMKQLMAALGIMIQTTTTTTNRCRRFHRGGMDRDIDALVAPEIIALFPLTTQCNHSCRPNAQIQSQEFVDAHMDVVALQDIAIGEEICISYISRRSNRFQRQTELRARYLFECHCDRCCTEEAG